MDNDEGQAADGGDQDRCCRDENEPLVHGRIRAGAEGKKDERPKNQHVRQRNDVKSLRIQACTTATHEQIIGRQNADNNHETCQHDTCNAEAAMDVHAAGGNQRDLRDEQQDPAGKYRPVHVDDPVGQRRVEHSGEVIGARKACENRCQHQQGHGRKK